jgi:hypothetical protein
MTDTDAAAILSRLDAIDAEIVSLRAEIVSLRTEMKERFARIESKLDEKPSHADVWRSSAAVTTMAFALVGGTVAVLKASDVIP